MLGIDNQFSKLRESILGGLNVLAFSGELPLVGLAVAANVLDGCYRYYKSSASSSYRDADIYSDGCKDSFLTPLFLAASMYFTSDPLTGLTVFTVTKNLWLISPILFDEDNDSIIDYIATFAFYLVACSVIAFYGISIMYALYGAGSNMTAAASSMLALHSIFAVFADNSKQAMMHLADSLPRAATFTCLMLYATPGLNACVMMAFLAPLASKLTESIVEWCYSSSDSTSSYSSYSK